MGDNQLVELIAELGAGPREVSRARRALSMSLSGWGWDGDSADVAVLLTSELVTNAIRHGNSPILLRAGLVHGRLRVEVVDHAVDGVAIRRAQDEDEDGRGLQLVDVLADSWGWSPIRNGKHVWFELARTI